jgi:hypothetical protein
MEHDTVHYPAWKRTVVIADAVAKMRVRDKRQIFITMRQTPEVSHNSLLPKFGITCGEFAVYHVLMDVNAASSQ